MYVSSITDTLTEHVVTDFVLYYTNSIISIQAALAFTQR